jgi:F-box-like
MAFYHLQTSNHLAEDVLLLIFDHLNVRDLMKCEAVCSQWRRVLLTETPWRRLFRRLIRSSICWQKGWRNLKIDAEGTQAVSHRALCKTILQQLKEVYRNWSSANFKESFVPIKFWRTRQQSNNRSLDLKLGNDCIAVRCFSGRVNDHIDKTLFVDGRGQVLHC